MKQSVKKDIVRQMMHSPRRFVAILLIVMLGVAFFAGVRATCPDMRLTLDRYFDEYRASDVHLLSTYGFTDGDVAAVKEAVGEGEVQPAYSVDGFVRSGDNRLLVHFMSYDLNDPGGLRQPVLMEGRLPEKPDECVLDTRLTANGDYRIGDTLTIETKEDEGITDSLNTLTYTVVGTVRSTYYISVERGSSSKGTGSLNGFALLPETNFTSPVYTDLYLRTAGAAGLSRFEDAYKDCVAALTDRLEETAEIHNPQRLEELWSEIDEQLDQARDEVEKGEQELADGRRQLEDARNQYQEGVKALGEKEEEYESSLSASKARLDEAGQQLEDSLAQLNSQEQQLNSAKARLDAGEEELRVRWQQWQQGQEELKELEAGIVQLRQTLEALPEGAPQAEALQQQLNTWQSQYDAASAELESGKQALDQEQARWEEGCRQWQEGKAALEAGKSQYESGVISYEEGVQQWESAREDGARQLAEGRSELEKAKEELTEAERKWAEESPEAEQKLADAWEQIAQGEEQRDALEEPQWIALDLEKNAGFAGYEQDTERVAAIGRVFPLIFFLVAALVSLTNMTRMVEDDRAVIGLYKALGYGRMTIACKYLVYAGAAAAGGIFLGLLWGQKLFPWVIADAYGILYNMPSVLTPFNVHYSLLAAAGALICVVVPAFAVCQKELFSTPASLMRPRAPKEGKRILLERIRPVWKHLNFSQKVTCRNIFRYKKRLLMTIFGIAGCTALVFTGFGLRESIQAIVGKQYDEIQKYDMQMGLADGFDEEEREELDDFLETDATVGDHLYFLQKSLDVMTDEGMKNAYLLVPGDMEKFDSFVTLRERKSQLAHTLTDEGVIVSEKLCTMLGIHSGDTIQLKDSDNRMLECRVDGITENYVQHYLYMSPSLYQRLTGGTPKMNTVLGQLTDTSEEAEGALSAALIARDEVSSVSFNTSIRQNFSDMISAMNIVVVVLILSAAALAFIVLFSLTTINVDERRRELATLKVLGFYDRETSFYVYRENLILTVLGVLFGLAFGSVLLTYIITTAEVDMVMFARTVGGSTYVLAALMTFLFALLVNWLMNRVIRRIDMVESMKSVE